MRVAVAMVVLTAAVLAGSRPAAAGDASAGDSIDGGLAGASESDGASGDGAIDDAATHPSSSESAGEDGASSGQEVVIACDAALCDTTQGRPTCDVAAQSIGGFAMAPGELAAVMALAIGIVARLVKRGVRGGT